MSVAQRRYRDLLLLSAILGVMVGLFSAGFVLIWKGLGHLVWDHMANPVHRVWFSALIGLLIGLLLKWFHDPGNMATIVFHFHRWGRLPMNDNLPILPASMVGLVAGQSAGPESALTQAGGSMGSWLAGRCRIPAFTRLLTLAGMGAGFGAFLGAPVGGAILWLEMLHTRGLEYYEAIIPTLVCSCVGYLVMVATIGQGIVPPWHLPGTFEPTAWTPLIAIGIGLACGPIARSYAMLFRLIGRIAQHRRIPLIVRTTFAGLIIGTLGYFAPLSYFYGGNHINTAMALPMTITALLVLLAAKMIAACITIRGHWQGGLIIPHMFMGALIGRLFAAAVPGIDPILAMLCCAAAFNAAATQTPLASALIVLALTGVGMPVPVFLASLAGFLAGNGVVLIENKQPRTEPHNFHLESVEPQLMP